MRKPAERAPAVIRKCWWWLRQVTGDAAYENYLRSRSRAVDAAGEGCGGLLSAEEFYVEKLRHKYMGISRCC